MLLDEAAEALAVAEVGDSILDMEGAFWSSVSNVAIQRGRVRLYKALRAGKLRAYIRVDDQPELRIVDTGYWFDPQHIFVELPALLAPQPQVGFELPSVVTGRNVPPECQGEPIFVLADDLAAMMPAPAEATQAPPAPPPPTLVPLRTKVDEEEFRLWVATSISERRNQTWIEKNASAAFPDKILPDREKLREVHRVEHRRLKGVDPKPGKEVA
jgi:hypothetical protein